jgi:NADP-dependent 3-hydroxy acid dehydrogenase YdfG
MQILTREKVFITEAASGIGKATAVAMAKAGGRLFLTDIYQEGINKTCSLIKNAGGEVCLARAVNVADYQAMAAFAQEVHTGYGPLDILVNVAGVALFSQVEDMGHSDWEKVINVNWAVNTGLVKTTEIHASSGSTDKFRKLFLKFALTPERVADIIMNAIRTRKFLVITSFNIKLLYFLKRHFPTLFHLIMLLLTRIMDKLLKRDV